MKKKLIAGILALCILAAMAAACGTPPAPAAPTPAPAAVGADTATPPPAPEPDGAPTAPPSDEPEGPATPTLDRIKAAGKLIMLTNAAFPPFEYLGADNQVAGVDADISKAIADYIGVELEIVDMDFDGIVMAIQSGKGDLGAAGMTATDERRKNVDFSIDYVSTTQMIIVQEGSAIATADDLVGKNIGVQLGTTGDLFAGDIEGANISGFKTAADAGVALANGQLDAVIIDAMPASQIVEANAALKLLDEPLTEEKYAIAIAKGNDDLKVVVDAVLENLLASGEVEALIEKHMTAAAQ